MSSRTKAATELDIAAAWTMGTGSALGSALGSDPSFATGAKEVAQLIPDTSSGADGKNLDEEEV